MKTKPIIILMLTILILGVFFSLTSAIFIIEDAQQNQNELTITDNTADAVAAAVPIAGGWGATGKAIKQGQKQLERYTDLAKQTFGGDNWKSFIITYD